jgi:voltage-gated potassium channel
LFINGEIVNKVPLFAHGSPGFIKCIVSFLQPQIYAPGDWIIRAGEAGNEMYFIAKGQVEILNEDGKYLTTLGSGSPF